MNIVLIGYRGSGKSAVGRELAHRLGWPLVDTDALIEQRAGKCIRDMFAQDGEPAFRDIEAAVVAQAAQGERQVISAGGGVILRSTNTAALKKTGTLVWLTAPPEVLWSRIRADTATAATRPDLTATGGIDEVRQVLERRTPLYAAAADLTFDTASLDPPHLADRILAALRSTAPHLPSPPA